MILYIFLWLFVGVLIYLSLRKQITRGRTGIGNPLHWSELDRAVCLFASVVFPIGMVLLFILWVDRLDMNNPASW